MVKVINIDTKTRTIRVENAADGDIKTWRTTESGAHFPIKKGESTKEALDKFVEKKRPEAKKEDDYDLKFAGDIKKGDIVSAGGKDYKIIQADRNWVIGLDGKGFTLKIRPELSYDTFKVKKQQPAKKDKKKYIEFEEQGQTYRFPKRTKQEEMWEQAWENVQEKRRYSDPAPGGNATAEHTPEETEEEVRAEYKKLKTAERAKQAKEKQQPAKPSKKADVSDIIKSYKEKMAALGPKAPVKKTDRVEADAIKEFMTRKLGANRPYEDYYQYWLNGMDKKTRDEFEEIYNESEAREMAFSELASDVDHSGLARGEPTYEELMQWAEKKKAEKATKSGSESFKSAMQTTMKAFPRLYDFEKPHLEEFANKVYDDIQNNPGKEKEVLEHLADAYQRHIAGLGPWVDTPTLAKKAFLDQMLESHLNKQSEDK